MTFWLDRAICGVLGHAWDYPGYGVIRLCAQCGRVEAKGQYGWRDTKERV